VLLSTGTIAALSGFAFLAAFTEAVVGGGGLIQLPGTVGIRLALAKGVGLVRASFLALVTVLLVNLAVDTLRPH
jgi:hypothetical protein